MNALNVVNIKCGGCEKKIIKSLEKIGLKDIKIDVKKQTISYSGKNTEQAGEILAKMGYPETGTTAANMFTKKAKSYISCVAGRWG